MRRTRQPTAEGIRIRNAMFEQNITGRELARRIGKSDATVSEVICGKNRSEETRILILKELGME